MRSTSTPLLATRRSSVVVAGAMLLALAVVVLAGTLAPKKADAATQIVTKTFSTSGQIRIPEGSVFGSAPNECTGATRGSAAPYPSERSVSAFPAGSQIRDVNLTLKNYSQNDVPDDVDVLLVHRGVNRTVMSDVGGFGNDLNNITLVLDDETTFFLPDSGNLGDGGRFKPRNAGTPSDEFPSPAPTQNSAAALSGFDNQNPNGTWSLFVRDDTSQDCGKFGGGWSIRIRAAVPV